MVAVILVVVVFLVVCVLAAKVFPMLGKRPESDAKAEQDLMGVGDEAGETGGDVDETVSPQG